MASYSKAKLRQRVIDAATTVLERDNSVGPLELLQQMRLLDPTHVHQWKRGHEMVLEETIQGSKQKINDTYSLFLQWTQEQKLEAISATYRIASRKGQTDLQVTRNGNPDREEFFKTCFRSEDLSTAKKQRIENQRNKTPDLVVHVLTGETSACSECQGGLYIGHYLFLEHSEPLCLSCADLDHLEFLPAGDTAMTRRSKKHSPLSAIVVRFNKRRRRYERQGLLVAASAIDQAEVECKADAGLRARRREQQAERTKQHDGQMVKEMIVLITTDYPGCPPQEALKIAEHTSIRGSGRVGRSAAGRALDDAAIRLAIRAWIRHQHTDYDTLLMQGVERMTARKQIASVLETVLESWR